MNELSPGHQRQLANAMGRAARAINEALAQAPHLAPAHGARRPALPRRYGKITPERAPVALPTGLRVRHRYFDQAGTIGPHGDGLYRADISGWLASVRVTWDDGRTSHMAPRDLASEEWAA